MKNVIVWYSHNTSADYLSGEHFPNDRASMAPNLCSTAYFEGSEERYTRNAFQTADGIQYWHFKHKDITYNTPWDRAAGSARDLRYWIEQLEKKLQAEGKDESIDALVVPIGEGLSESRSGCNFIQEFKARYPNAKVIVHNASAMFELEPHEKGSRYVWPVSEAAKIETMLDEAVITRDANGAVVADNHQSYGLADGVDTVTINHSGNYDMVQQNALRDALKMPHVQALGTRSSGLGR